MNFLLLTADPKLAAHAEAGGVGRIFVDLEILGKNDRQRGLRTVISGHSVDDVARVREALTTAEVLVRVNPLHPGTPQEIEACLGAGADWLMLPMFRNADELGRFCGMVAGRARVAGLLETKEAFEDLDRVTRVPGLSQIHVGLNDLSLSLGLDFLFEPLAMGLVDWVSERCRDAEIDFGFGGVARLGEGSLSAELVLGEHLRLNSTAVILARSFHGGAQSLADLDPEFDLKLEVQRLNDALARLSRRQAEEIERDRRLAALRIRQIAATVREKKGSPT